VPQNYHDFPLNVGEWLYVLTQEVTVNVPAAQKDVNVENDAAFSSGMPVWIKDSAHSEWGKVASVLGNVVTLQANLQYSYFTAKDATIDLPDIDFGRAAFAAAFDIEYLYEAYPGSFRFRKLLY
jgi:hypothetical protein